MPSRHSTRRPSRFQIAFDFEAPQPGESKRCSGCGQVQSLDCFHHSNKTRDGRVQKCKSCVAAYVCKGTNQRRDELAAAGQKDCSRCGETKALTDFSIQSTAKHGRKSNCKVCVYRADQERLKANRQARRDWELNHYRRNGDMIRARRKARYKAYPEVGRANSRRYRQNHLEECREYCRQYMREHHLEAKERIHKRRALILESTVVPITAAMIRQKFTYWGNRCWICGKPAQTIDHVKPISKGGPHILANLRPACLTCNIRKNAKWPFQKGDINGSQQQR